MSRIVCITFLLQLITSRNSAFEKEKNMFKKSAEDFQSKLKKSTTSYRLFTWDPPKLTDIKISFSVMVYIFTSTEYFLLYYFRKLSFYNILENGNGKIYTIKFEQVNRFAATISSQKTARNNHDDIRLKFIILVYNVSIFVV